jgi:hypothetical protein
VLSLDRSAQRHSWYGRATFRTQEAYNSVKKLLCPDLDGFIDEATEERLRQNVSDFVRPYVVIRSYLEALRSTGILIELASG